LLENFNSRPSSQKVGQQKEDLRTTWELDMRYQQINEAKRWNRCY